MDNCRCVVYTFITSAILAVLICRFTQSHSLRLLVLSAGVAGSGFCLHKKAGSKPESDLPRQEPKKEDTYENQPVSK